MTRGKGDLPQVNPQLHVSLGIINEESPVDMITLIKLVVNRENEKNLKGEDRECIQAVDNGNTKIKYRV